MGFFLFYQSTGNDTHWYPIVSHGSQGNYWTSWVLKIPPDTMGYHGYNYPMRRRKPGNPMRIFVSDQPITTNHSVNQRLRP